jgi:hypothetical protein
MNTIRTTLAATMLAAACTPAPAQGLQDTPMMTRCAEPRLCTARHPGKPYQPHAGSSRAND